MILKKFCFLGFFLFLIFNNLNADNIRFNTGNLAHPWQIWHGKVLKIKDNILYVKFLYSNNESTHKIHISRISSIYFNNKYKHNSPINLSNIIEKEVPSNLYSLRKIYFYHHEVKEEFENLKMKGMGTNTNLKGNIKFFDLENESLKIDVMIKKERKEIAVSELMKYIRAWVR